MREHVIFGTHCLGSYYPTAQVWTTSKYEVHIELISDRLI